MPGLSVYLGGPDIFLPNAVELYAAKSALCVAAGFTPAVPGDHRGKPPIAPLDPTSLSRAIFRADVATATASDFAIFHLTPFRGSSADAGTCVELGLMFGQGKPVFGYSNIIGDYLDRVVPRQWASNSDGDFHADVDGCRIEDFGNADNLMIDSALALAGAPLVRTDVPLPARYTDLTGFKVCLDLAQRYFAGKGAILCEV